MAEKKYYWLKMTDQFFEDKAIKKLRKIAGGDTYTIIYLKMLLTAIKQGNKMYFEGIEDDFMEELALELDEDTDNVKVTVSYLKSKGLIEVLGADEILLTQCAEMVGSETDAARRKRLQRDRERNRAIGSDPVPALEEKLQPLDCSMLPRDYEIKEDSKVQVIPVKAAEAQYYRELWTHNFVGSSATFNRALLIDGYVAGVFGISKMASDSVFVWYVMKVPHKIYRLGRLCYMLAQNREFVDTLLDNIEQEKVTKMRTAMLTRYPENKEVRGIMKLVNRVEDKKNGYKLTYEAELVEGRSEQQTLQEWLRRENEWQKNRAKASSKSKGAK